MNSIKLHKTILQSKLLSLYCEAHYFPYSSLKYHILLIIALYYNFKHGYQLKHLYLCENLPVESSFQIIYENNERTWAILPTHKDDGLSRIWLEFYKCWDYRKQLTLGGDYRILASIFSFIGSWTVALALFEDFEDFLNNN